MEKIAVVDGVWMYGDCKCSNADDAYCRFRSDYHESLGKAVHRRLDRIGQRKERMHGFGFVFDCKLPDIGLPKTRVPYMILALVDMFYFLILDTGKVPVGEDMFDEWLDRAFSVRSGMLRRTGTKSKVGRTGKTRKRFK